MMNINKAFKKTKRSYNSTSEENKRGFEKFYLTRTMMEVEYDQFAVNKRNQRYPEIAEENISDYLLQAIQKNKKSDYFISDVYENIEKAIMEENKDNILYCQYTDWIEQQNYSREEFAEKYDIEIEEIEHSENISDSRAIRMYYLGNMMWELFEKYCVILAGDVYDGEKDAMRQLLLEESFNKLRNKYFLSS
ncbi:MAG: hypothetical protein ACOCV1_08485 [Bacillota bacterium]